MPKSNSSSSEIQVASAPFAALPGPELVFGLVGAVGTDLNLLTEALTEELQKVGYTAFPIKVSSLLHQLDRYQKLGKKRFSSDFERVTAYMDAGSRLRERSKRGDFMALLAIAEIREKRRRYWGSRRLARKPIPKAAYILQSLKHPDEASTLRDVYGRAFFLLSAYASKDERRTRLAARIARSRHDSDESKYRDQAESLVQRDEKEDGKLGQNVREVFPVGDVFLDASAQPELRRGIARFIEVIFGNPFQTPTKDEYAMFQAYGAALRSSDLGRQVGVSIANRDGDIIAVGCNEVPRAGGGLYWADDPEDVRDFQVGFDSNARFKESLMLQLLEQIKAAGMLNAAASRKTVEAINEDLTNSPGLKESLASNLIEFGRSVHAEMAAITDAARRGISLRGATLYSTTFACHLCARHIVAAGIGRVVYIEPYPKSVAAQLYPDSICVDGAGNQGNSARVEFTAFVGIAPTSYLQAFRPSVERKMKGGRVRPWTASGARPKLRRFVLSYLNIEDLVVGGLLPSVLNKLRLRPINTQTK